MLLIPSGPDTCYLYLNDYTQLALPVQFLDTLFLSFFSSLEIKETILLWTVIATQDDPSGQKVTVEKLQVYPLQVQRRPNARGHSRDRALTEEEFTLTFFYTSRLNKLLLFNYS